MATKAKRLIEDVAIELGIEAKELRERIFAKTNNNLIFASEHLSPKEESLIPQIEIELKTTQNQLSESAEIQTQQEEIPILEEEIQPKKRSKRSSSLTKTKKENIQQTRQSATQTNAGISETLTLLQAQQGLIDSSQAGTAYLATYNANLINVKGQGLTVMAAEMLQDINQKTGFNLEEVLQQVGVPIASETREKLQETMGQVLGKVENATQEIQDTSWGNGFNLQTELSQLDNLMNSNISTEH